MMLAKSGWECSIKILEFMSHILWIFCGCLGFSRLSFYNLHYCKCKQPNYPGFFHWQYLQSPIFLSQLTHSWYSLIFITYVQQLSIDCKSYRHLYLLKWGPFLCQKKLICFMKPFLLCFPKNYANQCLLFCLKTRQYYNERTCLLMIV